MPRAARPKALNPRPHAATRRAMLLPSRVLLARRPAVARRSRHGRRSPSRPCRPRISPASAAWSVSALDGAIRSTGIDATLLTALAWQESRFDPRARNRRSTARGLMQFTEATWLEAVRDHGPQHGLQYEAAVLSTDPASGSITTRQPRTRSRILELRDNPRYAAALAAARINRARIALAQSLGRPVGPADLYLVHLLGPSGAQRLAGALCPRRAEQVHQIEIGRPAGRPSDCATRWGGGRHPWPRRAAAVRGSGEELEDAAAGARLAGGDAAAGGIGGQHRSLVSQAMLRAVVTHRLQPRGPR